MSRDKQTEIEKITDVLDKCTYDNKLTDEMALMLYNAGYRKSTDLAEEIFAEIISSGILKTVFLLSARLILQIPTVQCGILKTLKTLLGMAAQ